MGSVLVFSRSDNLEELEYELKLAFQSEPFAFTTKTYVTNPMLASLVHELKELVAGRSLFDFQLGRFGPEYAGGAALLRFHRIRHEVFLTIHMQGRYSPFNERSVAAEFKNYVQTDIGSVQSFLDELDGFCNNERAQAACSVLQFTDE